MFGFPFLKYRIGKQVLFSLAFRRQTLAIEMHLPALETLQSEPCIDNKLLLQSSLHTSYDMVFFQLDGITREQRNCRWLVLFYTQDLVGCNLATDLFPLLGALPRRWCWDNSSFLVVTQISAGDEISSPLGMEREQQLCFWLLIRGHVPIRCFQARQQPCSALAIAADVPVSGGERRGFLSRSGFM